MLAKDDILSLPCAETSAHFLLNPRVCAGGAKSPWRGGQQGESGACHRRVGPGRDTRAPGWDTRAPGRDTVGTHGSWPWPVGNFQSAETLNDLSGHFVTRNMTSREKPPKPRNLLQHCTHSLNIFMTSYVIMLKVITSIELLRIYNCSTIFAWVIFFFFKSFTDFVFI